MLCVCHRLLARSVANDILYRSLHFSLYAVDVYVESQVGYAFHSKGIFKCVGFHHQLCALFSLIVKSVQTYTVAKEVNE